MILVVVIMLKLMPLELEQLAFITNAGVPVAAFAEQTVKFYNASTETGSDTSYNF